MIWWYVWRTWRSCHVRIIQIWNLKPWMSKLPLQIMQCQCEAACWSLQNICSSPEPPFAVPSTKRLSLAFFTNHDVPNLAPKSWSHHSSLWSKCGASDFVWGMTWYCWLDLVLKSANQWKEHNGITVSSQCLKKSRQKNIEYWISSYLDTVHTIFQKNLWNPCQNLNFSQLGPARQNLEEQRANIDSFNRSFGTWLDGIGSLGAPPKAFNGPRQFGEKTPGKPRELSK